MTPEELAALFSPFLACWILIFLTIISETGSEEDLEEERSDTWREGKTYAHVPRKERHTDNKEDLKSWNVSNFFGVNTGTRKVARGC